MSGEKPRPSLWSRLRAITHTGEPTPPPDERVLALIRRIHELAHLEVRDVMTPRVDVVYLTMPVTPEAVAEAVRDTGHSCFPVVLDDLDDVDGVLFVNDLFRSSSTKRAVGVSLPTAPARPVARDDGRPGSTRGNAQPAAHVCSRAR